MHDGGKVRLAAGPNRDLLHDRHDRRGRAREPASGRIAWVGDVGKGLVQTNGRHVRQEVGGLVMVSDQRSWVSSAAVRTYNELNFPLSARAWFARIAHVCRKAHPGQISSSLRD